MADIHRADPKFRRIFFLLMGLLLVMVWPIRAGIEQYFGWLTQHPDQLSESWPQIVVIVAIAFSPLLFLGFHLSQLGLGVIRAQCFPGPTMKTLIDMPVMKGRQAVLRGQMLMACGLLVGLGAIAIPIFFSMILQTLTQTTS